jgi:capsid protein
MLPNGEKFISDHGLELDEFGGVKSYIVCKYNKNKRNLLFDKRIFARDAIYSGYFEEYSQTRGISPLLAAVNELLDIKESKEAILLKIKLHAIFGIAFVKDAIDGIGDGLPSAARAVEDEDAGYEDENTADVAREVDLTGGPFTLNLLEGEKADTIESNTPPESVKAYTELAIRSALLALDIPYSFFDGTGTNFAKVIADRKMYEIAAEAKMEKNLAAYEEYVDWKLWMWTQDGTLPMPYEEIRDYVHVRPYPSPWLDKASEIDAEERAISLGIKSIPQLARERGVDPFEVLEQQSEFLKRANELKVPIYVGHPGSRSERDNRLDNEIRADEAEGEDEPDEE